MRKEWQRLIVCGEVTVFLLAWAASLVVAWSHYNGTAGTAAKDNMAASSASGWLEWAE